MLHTTCSEMISYCIKEFFKFYKYELVAVLVRIDVDAQRPFSPTLGLHYTSIDLSKYLEGNNKPLVAKEKSQTSTDDYYQYVHYTPYAYRYTRFNHSQ